MATRRIHRSIPYWTLLVIVLVGCASVSPPVEVTKRGWILELPEEERVAVRSLLRSQQFEQLDKRFQHLQVQYEQGRIDDRSLMLEYQGFYNSSPENEPFLTEWVTAHPTSYVARVARGIYYARVAIHRRGERFVNETPPESMAQMVQYLALSEKDLTTSLTLTPKPIVSLVELLEVSQYLGNRVKGLAWLKYADGIDPQNYWARRRHLISLEPRWGGSYEEMWEFVSWCQNRNTPNDYLRIFESRIYHDQAKSLAEAGQKEKAVPLYRKALSLLDGINTIERVDTLKGLVSTGRGGNLGKYLNEVEEALRLSPKDRVMLGYRGYILFTQGNREEGLQAYKQAAELGDAYSQLQLARKLYYGVPSVLGSNQDEAVQWATRAAKKGYAPAKEFLDDVAKHRSRSEEINEH